MHTLPQHIHSLSPRLPYLLPSPPPPKRMSRRLSGNSKPTCLLLPFSHRPLQNLFLVLVTTMTLPKVSSSHLHCFPPFIIIAFPAFANFFSDDMSNDTSKYYPTMYDDMRDQAIAGTAVPRRRLRKLLVSVRSSLPRPSPSCLIKPPSMSSSV